MHAYNIQTAALKTEWKNFMMTFDQQLFHTEKYINVQRDIHVAFISSQEEKNAMSLVVINHSLSNKCITKSF